MLLAAAAAASLVLPAHAAEPAEIPSPGEIAAAAPAKDWTPIAPSDLLVMDLAPDAKGKPRRIVIQLMPAPFSQGWIANIRKLAAAHWWDGTSVNRVQDNYVVQWGDATEKKPLPTGLGVMDQDAYALALEGITYWESPKTNMMGMKAIWRSPEAFEAGPMIRDDSYADASMFWKGWPVAIAGDAKADEIFDRGKYVWPVHCYGMVGVGRNMSPDAGSGAELYAVIGHAPRHLDRNIALIGRVVSGIEHLSSLPRGMEALGFYKSEAERTPIASIRLATELPAAEQPKFEYLSTESDSFAKYADARANRRDPFFIRPAGGADICNIPVPVRAIAAK